MIRPPTLPPSWIQLLRVAVCSAIFSSCSHQVPIPAPANDQAPQITINGFVIGGSGTVSHDNVSSSQPVQVSLGAELQFTVTATNPGGVKSLTYTLTHGRNTTTVSASTTPDSDGKVPDQLTILGTDGAGNSGNIPVILAETPATSTTPIPASVSVSAANYNGMSTDFVVTYVPTWSAPQIVSFTATPDYINIGSASKLSWKISGCYAYCLVRLEGRDGIGFKDLVESHPNRSAFGSLSVSPSRSTHTRYTLTAENPSGSTATPKEVTIQLAPSAAAQSGQVFFFKMTRSGGVTPCFTIAIYAPDASMAKQMAEGQNGGYSAAPITEAEYYNGC